ncbi:FAD-binding oxidoreductase [Pandoraea communis]|uniref:D-2-hydroxyacid dehydrogenase n=1 Tax=Pandoraea communis TaxID=2508297 RepID=A0A5E4V1U4_9BURK|nr:FAD-binding oxidoreductase [Pandoraea communis]MDM8356135.1 FAD-binding oxidoreductase [Pandoraea communis]VVE06207.1 D-2-hydroxyacid dehydrogenase [Pandoraea communis]
MNKLENQSRSVALVDLPGTLSDVAEIEKYCTDWSGLRGGRPAIVYRPRSSLDVARIVQHHSGDLQRITIQGGLTGLAGGAVPDDGDIVISMERLDQIEEFDAIGGTVTVQAGVVLSRLAETVEAQDWYFPLDIGARGSCQIGGNIATNAGGNRVLRYGPMRDLVLGVEVVLADGRVVSMMNRVLKNNTGPDLKHLFIGTEGTFGIVTRAVLRLFPKPEVRRSALCALSSFVQVTALLKAARGRLPGLSSFEVMWDDFLRASTRELGRSMPFADDHNVYVLVEAEGSTAPQMQELFEGFFGEMIEESVVSDVIVAQSQAQSNALWEIRDGIGELLKSLSPFVSFDVGIPLRVTGEYVERVRNLLETAFPAASHLFFGHLGDGNLHIVTGPHVSEADQLRADEIVYRLVEEVGGSISAEHGIGRIKKPFLHISRSGIERELMAKLKATLDPAQVLNAGRIL